MQLLFDSRPEPETGRLTYAAHFLNQVTFSLYQCMYTLRHSAIAADQSNEMQYINGCNQYVFVNFWHRANLIYCLPIHLLNRIFIETVNALRCIDMQRRAITPIWFLLKFTCHGVQ